MLYTKGDLQNQNMISKRSIPVVQRSGQFTKQIQLPGNFSQDLDHQSHLTNLNFSYIQRSVGNQLAKNLKKPLFPIQRRYGCNNSVKSIDECLLDKQVQSETLQRQMITPHGQGGGYPGLLDRDRRANCTPNPHGKHLPSVGTDHQHPSKMLPCLLTEGQVLGSKKWCLDAQQIHKGERCYREIPKSYCAPADQYCYTGKGCCHNSRDHVSIVDPSSPGAGRTCDTAYRCMPGHIVRDVLPEMLSNFKRKISG